MSIFYHTVPRRDPESISDRTGTSLAASGAFLGGSTNRILPVSTHHSTSERINEMFPDT
jgi:hypothetical protein